jgi:hypothetical protein
MRDSVGHFLPVKAHGTFVFVGELADEHKNRTDTPGSRYLFLRIRFGFPPHAI